MVRDAMVKLIIGLGNPGKEYVRTRHNVGFLCIDHLAKKWGIKVSSRGKNAILHEGKFAETDVVLIKPRNFVNRSGIAIVQALHRFKASPCDLLIIYDDMHLSLGTIRLRAKGGAGGHNGIESVIDAVGTRNFPRLRVGIGTPTQGINSVEHVLGTFSMPELESVANVVLRVGVAVEYLLKEGISYAVNEFNQN